LLKNEPINKIKEKIDEALKVFGITKESIDYDKNYGFIMNEFSSSKDLTNK